MAPDPSARIWAKALVLCPASQGRADASEVAKALVRVQAVDL
jgi:hypothetical protein